MIGRIVPEILVGLSKSLDIKASADHRIASAEQFPKGSLGICRIPGEADRRLRAYVPGSILVAASNVGWVLVTCEHPRLKNVADSRWSVHGGEGSAVIGTRQIVIVSCEIPAQSVVDRQVRCDA